MPSRVLWFREKWLIVALTLLAFGLRIYRLDVQSYWIDEILSVRYATMSLPQLWESLQTVRAVPPLYHLITIYWVDLWGAGEFSLRFLSVISSVAAIPLMYRLGKTIDSSRLGLLAALLLVFAPYQVWHAQDARNYSMLTAATLASMWAFLNLWRAGGWRWWLLYVISTEWALMIHYHGLIIIGVQGLFFLLAWQRYWRKYLAWGGTLAVILLPYLLWFTLGSQLWQSDHWLPKVGLIDSYLRSAIAYSVGEMVPGDLAAGLIVPFVMVWMLGIIYAFGRRWRLWRGWEMAWFLLVYTLAPNVAAWIFSELRTPVYLERYLITVQVGYLLTIAVGLLAVYHSLRRVGQLPRWVTVTLPALVLLGLLSINVWVLHLHYTDPLYAKPDWRQVADTIAAFNRAEDGVIVTGDGGEILFDFYFDSPATVYDDFNTPVPPDDVAIARLGELAAAHPHLWYSPYGVPIDPLLETWLAQNAYPTWHQWLGRKRLALYATEPPSLGRVETPATVFSTGTAALHLLEVRLPATPTVAGNVIPLQSIWQSDAPLTTDYQLSLRLVNDQGDLFVQSDYPPLNAQNWLPGQPQTDRRGLWVPPDTPPGHYLLQWVVYNPDDGQRLGDPFALADIIIAPAEISSPATAFDIPNRGNRPLGSLNVRGYALPAQLQPGNPLWVWLTWQATNPAQLAGDEQVRFTLQAGDQTVTHTEPLTAALGSTASWQPNQLRRGVYHLPTHPRLSGAEATLRLELLDGMGNVLAETALDQMPLQNRNRVFQPTEMDTPTQFSLGQPPQATLQGYTVEGTFEAGQSVTIQLLWQAAELPLSYDYTIFVQLFQPTSGVIAQSDQPPQGGNAPTTTWLTGEFLLDEHTLALPAELPAGDYRLLVGMYDPGSGARLPAFDAGGTPLPDSAIALPISIP